MNELKNNNLYRTAAKLVIAATLLYTMFGSGVHIHALFDHIFDHGDVHVLVHTHNDTHQKSHSHSHSNELEGKDTHQHPTVTVDLTRTLVQKSALKDITKDNSSFSAAVSSTLQYQETLIPLYLDLPPPDHLHQTTYLSSYSLRGPPMG